MQIPSEQAKPAGHLDPAQQGAPSPVPQTSQVPETSLVQFRNTGALWQKPELQQGAPAAPHVSLHVPRMLSAGRSHARPAAQDQSMPLFGWVQQVWPTCPQGTQTLPSQVAAES